MGVNVPMCVCKYIVSLMRATPLTPSQRSAFVQSRGLNGQQPIAVAIFVNLNSGRQRVGDADQSPACIQDDEETESLGKT